MAWLRKKSSNTTPFLNPSANNQHILVIVQDGTKDAVAADGLLAGPANDWVAPGDVIATVGDSGGQQQTSLYFEVRQGTRPLNPRSWVTRQPGT